jgi:hypothetical protein
MPNEDASSRRKRDVWGLLGRIGRPGLADRSSPANQRNDSFEGDSGNRCRPQAFCRPSPDRAGSTGAPDAMALDGPVSSVLRFGYSAFRRLCL